MSVRDRIWYAMLQSKFLFFFFDFMKTVFSKRERVTNISLLFLSICSASSWAIFKEVPVFLGTINILAYVAAVYRPYYNFQKNVAELDVLLVMLDSLNIEYERLWFDIDNNRFSDEDANDKLYTLKEKGSAILRISGELVYSEKLENEAKGNAIIRMATYEKTSLGVINHE